MRQPVDSWSADRSATFQLYSGGSRTVRVRLTHQALKLFRSSGTLTALLSVGAHDSSGATAVTRNARVMLVQ